jgi:FKBP-type peptidyl-prolyl cis-trans isomerase
MITFLLASLLACGGSTPEPAKTEAPAVPAAEGDVPAPADVAAPPADAQKTATGLSYKVLTPGDGTTKPVDIDTVEVNYTGWTTDGKMFDSSTKRKKPAKFKLKNVIPGWTEGLQLMSKGEKTRFWIPVELAYNNKPGKPAGMLVFDVELVSITEGPKPIPAPEDVAAAPADAKKTKSGLSYKVLTPGTGKDHPKADQMVEVDYTGWTSVDGVMFDSSVSRGRPASFNLGRVIPGWTEGVQLMVVGEKTRFWIPADLAYGETPKRPGAPSGQLTFDIELKNIKDASSAPAVNLKKLDSKPGGLPGGMPSGHPAIKKPATPDTKGEK